MDSLSAPWRIRYILGEKEPGCFFCRKSQEAADAKNHIVIRERQCFALLNTYPYNAGHLMVAPYKHTGEIDELSAQEVAEISTLVVRCKQLLAKAIKPHGFNIGLNLGRCAGAGVLDHVHWHIVPRWDGDTNFMPVLADTHVLPQALDEIYDLLVKELKRG